MERVWGWCISSFSSASSIQHRTFLGSPSLLLSRTQDRLSDTGGLLAQLLSPTEPRADAGEEKKDQASTQCSPLITPHPPTICSSVASWARHHYCVVRNPLWTTLPSHLPLNPWGFLICPCSLHTLHFPFAGRNEGTAGK